MPKYAKISHTSSDGYAEVTVKVSDCSELKLLNPEDDEWYLPDDEFLGSCLADIFRGADGNIYDILAVIDGATNSLDYELITGTKDNPNELKLEEILT